MYEIKTDNILSEGLFSKNKLEEVTYSDTMLEANMIANKIKKLIKSSVLGNNLNIKVGDELFPRFLRLAKNDGRNIASFNLSAKFSFLELERKTGLTTNIVSTQLNQIIQEALDDSKLFIGGLFYASESKSEIIIRLMTDYNYYCLKDIFFHKGSVETIARPDFIEAIKRYVPQIITVLKKHPLGKKMFIVDDSNAPLFKVQNAVGSYGIVRQLSGSGFSDYDFRDLDIDSYSASINIAYLLDETILMGTKFRTALYTMSGADYLFFSTKPHVKIEE